MRIGFSALFIAPALFFALPGSLFAQERRWNPLVTDRPDFTEAPVTVPKGRVQFEGGYTWRREGELKEHGLGELLVRIGLLGSVELRVGVPSYTLAETSAGSDRGWGDSSLGAKIQLMEATPRFDLVRPSVALILATTLPTGSDGFGEAEPQPEAKLAVGWAVSEWFAFGSNLNYAYARDNGDAFGQFSGSIAVGLGITERLGGYAEYFGFAPESPDGPDSSFLNGGFNFLLNQDLQLDVRAGIGLDEPYPNYFAGAGFAWRL